MDSANDLLSHYVENGSETAFAEVVNRYLNFVYSIAARRLGSPSHEAIQDVVQTVFLALAQKAGQLRKESNLGGWLHRHTCFVTSKHLRAEQQRLKRQRAAAQDENLKPDSTWSDLSPVIDDAIQHLNETDKAAVLMRFFEGIDFRTIGAKLGVTEGAAQKRVSRATEKLRELLAGNGIRISALSLGTLLAVHSLQAAPPEWASILVGNIRHLHRLVPSAKPPVFRVRP
ncbi:MAG: polymerase, sigma-24 subunit, subfamily [Verrucomicrobiales bacterium]|nr:polymerase, sigma-24 subunit, subfamily [Verrucomicrobiales bacterium]